MKHIILQHQSNAQLLEYLLHHHISLTTLIVCCNRIDFLVELHRSCYPMQSNEYDHTLEQLPQEHLNRLSLNTVEVLALSSTIKIAFTPTLQHLRAYLSCYQPSSVLPFEENENDGTEPPTLAIWGLVKMHRPTADFTAQGLSRTLALAREAAHLAGQTLIVAEPPAVQDLRENEKDLLDHLPNPWTEPLPLLMDSVKIEGGKQMLAKQDLDVGTVMFHWCDMSDNSQC